MYDVRVFALGICVGSDFRLDGTGTARTGMSDGAASGLSCAIGVLNGVGALTSVVVAGRAVTDICRGFVGESRIGEIGLWLYEGLREW